ncbi:MAG: hypothetical protein QM780_15650 [Hyphomicrobium sp.]|uniref:hypothetical protein n=1 Tax=Hyphomicrobium sp. TaxID=82 RepID=UPI0039E2855C
MLMRRIAGVLPFDRNERHSSLIIFLAMIVALLFATGAALDYARVVNMREGIALAVNAASAAGLEAMDDTALTDEGIKAIVLSHFDKVATLARHVGTVASPSISIDRQAGAITVDAKGSVAMVISSWCGVRQVAVPATSTASRAPRNADAL